VVVELVEIFTIVEELLLVEQQIQVEAAAQPAIM
jgi:hypothetical protein